MLHQYPITSIVIITEVITLTIGFYFGYIKYKLLENTTKYLESNVYNYRGTITLTSTVFGNGDPIVIWYTDDRKNISPPLSWSKLPAGNQSLVLMASYNVTASPRYMILHLHSTPFVRNCNMTRR